MRRLSSKPVLAVALVLSLAAALSGCGRKGPVEPPVQNESAPATSG